MKNLIAWIYAQCKFAKAKSWMVAGYPDDDSVKRILKLKSDLDLGEAKKVFGRDYFHVTLRYWKGEDDEIASDAADWLLDNVEGEPLECEASGLEILGHEDSLVIRLESAALGKLQKKIDDGIQELGVPASDFPTFKAHLTIAQGVKEAPELPKGFKIRLDKWKLIDKDEEPLWES